MGKGGEGGRGGEIGFDNPNRTNAYKKKKSVLAIDMG